MDDRELLRVFAATRSADAFTEIVRANAGIAYAAARRQLRDSALAEDVTQAVFLLLSQKPRSVNGSIAGWLIVATRYACRDARKLARRREKHERRAAEMNPIAVPPESAESEWQEYAPHLDGALASLSPGDRDVIALRFLRGLKLADIAESLGIKPKAAERRLGRALDRLRSLLLARTATPAAEALAAQLADHGAMSAPARLVQSIARNAPPDSSSPSSMIARFARQSMRRANLKVAAGILLCAGVAGASVAATLMVARQLRPTPAPLQSPGAAPFAAAFPDARPGPAGVAATGPLTLAEILQRVQARDANLANLAYDLASVETNVNSDGARDPLETTTYSIRQERGLYWLHLTTRKPDGTLEGEEFTNWDGKVARQTTYHPTMRAPFGMVVSEKSHVFPDLAYDGLLGFPWEIFTVRNGYESPPIMKPASRWLADAIAAHDAELRWLAGGLAVVTIRQGQTYKYRRILFDTTKGCAPVRYECRYEFGSNFSYEVAEAVKTDRIDGVWIATSVLIHSGTSSTPLVETQFRNTVSHFTIGKTTDADLALRFSPGMRINDEVAGVAYLIDADGALNQLPYEDEKTGHVSAVAAGTVLNKPPTAQRFDAVIPPAGTAR